VKCLLTFLFGEFVSTAVSLSGTLVTLIESRLRIIAVSAHLHQYFGTEIFVKARGTGIVVSGTWFLLRWKQLLIDNMTSKQKIDQVLAPTIDLLLHETFTGKTKIIYLNFSKTLKLLIGFCT
jgi:hypothetical protein